MGCATTKHAPTVIEEKKDLFHPSKFVPEEEVENYNTFVRRISMEIYDLSKKTEKDHPLPPDRVMHEKHMKALDNFLGKVDGSPTRFKEIVGIYRDKSGMRSNSDMSLGSTTIQL
eukprot:symbB.v1.2.007168.t1/scaffold437.1/size205459/7